jgi:hypothetical protein
MSVRNKKLLAELINQPKTTISIGGLGAIAEFDSDSTKACFNENNELKITSAKGAFRLKLNGTESLLAYETLSQEPTAWLWGMMILTKKNLGFAKEQNKLHELGPDTKAINQEDKDSILFDLGVGLSNSSFNIRTKNPGLLRILRSNEGLYIAEGDNNVLDAIIDFSPHRVVTSSIARVEVYQEINRHETPSGPHTHLLPSLLKNRRTHVAGIPVADSQSPQLTLHPENPLFDQFGHLRTFSETVYERFAPLVDSHCVKEFHLEKERLKAAFKKREKAINYAPPMSRLARLAYKVALRQLSHTFKDRSYLDTWLRQARNK